METNSTILVTGGGGYVGGVLVPSLLLAGYRVRLLDTFWFSEAPIPHPRLEVTIGDIRDISIVERCLEGVDAVIPLAAMSNDPSGDLLPDITREINLDASIALGRVAQRAGVRRLINISSASVYGATDAPDVVETLPTRPQTLYAQYKAELEGLMLASDGGPFVVTSVRPATLSGYAPRLRLDLTVHIFTFQAILDGRLQVFGGEQQRPNLSVHDLVHALRILLEAPAGLVRGKSFNLVESNNAVQDIARQVADAVGRPEIQVTSVPTVDKRSYRLNGDRARELLNFRPAYGIAHSVSSVAAALLDGRVPDAAGPRWRNVEQLKLRPPAVWVPSRPAQPS